MIQQVKIVASPWECVGEVTNLARENVRKQGQSPTCVSRIDNSLEMPRKEKVSGKILLMDTQELVNDHEVDRGHVRWAPQLSVSQDA